MTVAKNWGAFNVQVKGKLKWTKVGDGFYWGSGYDMTREQAEAAANQHRRDWGAVNPAREYRVVDRASSS